MTHVHQHVSLDKLAFSATLHCLTGCSVGEVLGMVLAGLLGWSSPMTLAVSVALAFVFGYSLTMRPLRMSGLSWKQAWPLALASDTLSIGIMEVVDNATMLLVPGAMNAHPSTGRFWASMIGSLVLAGAAAFPVNRWLISRGRGHAVVHAHHREPGVRSAGHASRGRVGASRS